MVMAPGGNLGGDAPFYPQQNPKIYRFNFSSTLPLNSVGLQTVITGPTVPAGTYMVFAMINASDVTTQDSLLAQITPVSNQAGSISGSVKITPATNDSLCLCGIIVVPQGGSTILLRAQGAATSNLTVNGTDPDSSNFQATWLQVIPIP